MKRIFPQAPRLFKSLSPRSGPPNPPTKHFVKPLRTGRRFTLIDAVKGDGNSPIKPSLPSIHPLNQILYGPPGTGKSWHTVTRAVAIIEGGEVSEVAQEDRATVKRRFDEHRDAGRIEMVTFTPEHHLRRLR